MQVCACTHTHIYRAKGGRQFEGIIIYNQLQDGFQGGKRVMQNGDCSQSGHLTRAKIKVFYKLPPRVLTIPDL